MRLFQGPFQLSGKRMKKPMVIWAERCASSIEHRRLIDGNCNICRVITGIYGVAMRKNNLWLRSSRVCQRHAI
jgi:hypothetical protein